MKRVIKAAKLMQLEDVILEHQPHDTPYIEYDCDTDNEHFVKLFAYSGEQKESIDKLDSKAVDTLEGWATAISNDLKGTQYQWVSDAIESELKSDWCSGMSLSSDHASFSFYVDDIVKK